MAVRTLLLCRLGLFLLLFGESHCSLTGGPLHRTTPHEFIIKRNISLAAGTVSTSSFKNVPLSGIDQARATVAEAVKQWGVFNKARFENPRHNVYSLRPGSADSKVRKRGAEMPVLTPEIKSAAALLAELRASKLASSDTTSNSTTPAVKRGSKASFWMEDIQRSGTQPYGGNSSYQVFRNVQDKKFGAKGDGVTDDTDAINAAIQAGDRCGDGCYGTSTTNAIVYFPGGTYLVSSYLTVLYGTQLIGNPNDMPILKATNEFIGLGVISTDYYTGGGTGADGLDQEYYINTANFYRQIRNFVIDVTDVEGPDAPPEGVAGIHYQVSQATSLFNVKFNCSQNSDTKSKGIFAENGSGGFMSDLTFVGGQHGIHGGNQQFTAHRLTFTNVKTAIWVIWDWGWTWKSIHIINSVTGFNLTSESGAFSETGSVFVQDSIFENTKNAIVTFPPSDQPGKNSTGITLDNVAFKGVTNAIIDTKGKTWLQGSVGSVDTYVLGPLYKDLNRTFTLGSQISTLRVPELLGPKNGLPKPIFLERIRPQYNDLPASQFISVKKNGAKGDGVTDDTAALQRVFDQYAGSSQVVFIDAGSYLVTNTLKISPGVKIVGELWAQLVASVRNFPYYLPLPMALLKSRDEIQLRVRDCFEISADVQFVQGERFSDANAPIAMLQIGEPGQRGSVEIQDLLFTTVGATAGLIAVEWNLEADSPGSAALWDCHARIGGAIGSQLTSQQCPPLTSGINPKCRAASLMFHLTSTASAYIENMWLWVADHDLDDPALQDANNTMPQLSVYVARGFLIESQKPTWLYATASEHSIFYQYSFYKAKNIHAGMIQTETPYYQPNPTPPAPFEGLSTVLQGDPDYSLCASNKNSSGCDSSWAVRISKSANISFAGAGLYSWFTKYDQSTCIDARTCQNSLIELTNNSKDIIFLNLVTIGAKNMMTTPLGAVAAADNESNNKHPKWSYIAALQAAANGLGPDDPVIYVNPTVWPQPHPTMNCTPPCIFVLPPSTPATPTVVVFTPYVTTLEVGWMTTSTVGGSVTTKFTSIIQTTTLSIPSTTLTSIPYSNYHVTDTSALSYIVPVPSILPDPIVITDSYPPGVTGIPPTRTITPPPYPWSGTAITSFAPVVTYQYDGTEIWVSGTSTVTRTKGKDTILFGPTGIIIDGTPIPSPTSATTTNNITIGPPFLWFTNFPSQTVSPVTTEVPKPTTTVINGKTEPVIPCSAWFFFICTDNVKGIVLFGWELPGIYPGGGPPKFPKGFPPPPGIDFPPKIPWPPITIGPDGVPTYESMPEDEPCETATSSFCDNTVSKGSKSTTTISICTRTTIGCQPTGSDTATTTSACKAPSSTNKADKRAPAAACAGTWGVVYPANTADFATNEAINNAISNFAWLGTGLGSVYRSATTPAQGSSNFETFFWAIEKINDQQIETLRGNALLGNIQIIRPMGTAVTKQTAAQAASLASRQLETDTLRDDLLNQPREALRRSPNSTLYDDDLSKRSVLILPVIQRDAHDEMVMISLPPNANTLPESRTTQFVYDESAGRGQTIYALEYGWEPNAELSNLNLRPLYTGPNPRTSLNDNAGGHGTCIASKIGGGTLGIARNAKEVVITVIPADNSLYENFVDGLVKIYDDILLKEAQTTGYAKTVVVNLSIQTPLGTRNAAGAITQKGFSQPAIDKMAVIIKNLLARGVVVVTGSGNDNGNPSIQGWPARFGVRWNDAATRSGQNPYYMEDLIVVGAVETTGQYWWKSSGYAAPGPNGDWVGADVPIYAPGAAINCADLNNQITQGHSGTSEASATVAGLAAYFRALYPDLSPRGMKAKIIDGAWRRNPSAPFPNYPPTIWNEMGRVFCAGANKARWEDVPSVDFMTNGSESVVEKRQESPGSCSLNPTITNPANNPSGGVTFTIQSGPTDLPCKTGCGTLCSSGSIFCTAQGPNQVNPDFWDPLDPKSPQNPLNPGYITPTNSPTPKPAPTPTPTPTSTITTPAAPPTNPIPTGTNPNWIMYGQTAQSGQGISQSYNYALWGYAANGVNYEPCNLGKGTSKSYTENDASKPVELTGIGNVFGDTCQYVVTTPNFSAAKVGDPVGQLICPSFYAARCTKLDTFYSCIGGVSLRVDISSGCRPKCHRSHE